VGITAATLARIGGVQRSTALRWFAGSTPRSVALRRLTAASASLDVRPEKFFGELANWLDRANESLSGLTPATWIREGRDTVMLRDAWIGGAQPPARTVAAPAVGDLKQTVSQLRSAEKRLTGIDITPMLNALASMNQISTQLDSIGEVVRSSHMLEAASTAIQIGRVLQHVNTTLRTPVLVYADIATHLPRADMIAAFGGMSDIIPKIRGNGLLLAESDMLARLAAESRPPIGAVALGIDLQLSSALAAALTSVPRLRTPFMMERIGWRAWLPAHPASLIRTSPFDNDWLIGETHNATQATVAALGRSGEGVDEGEVRAALASVIGDFPDLLSLPVPGTGASLRRALARIAPRVIDSLAGALDRLRGGGADDARQASTSLRAALDQLADELVPGPKKGRAERYEKVLSIELGDPGGKLLYHQIGILYESYVPLSLGVHDELDLEAVRAHAVGMLSAIAAVVARWIATHPSSPGG